jgi:hypothetical protein
MKAPVLGEELQRVAGLVGRRKFHGGPLRLNDRKLGPIGIFQPAAIAFPDDELIG